MSFTITFGGEELPVKAMNIDRNLTSSMSNSTQSIGNSDGVILLSSAYKEKTITIDYLVRTVTAESAKDFRREMSKFIGGKETKKLIFSDEPDKYYDAIITGEQTLKEDYPQSTGTLSFLVPDALAHSTATKTFTAAINSKGIMEATIINEGTASVPVNYTIKHNHDNGYIGIASKEGVMQFGKTDEVDGVPYESNASEVLIDTLNFSGFAADTGQNAENADKLTNGSLSVQTVDGESCLGISSRGSGFLHGGMISRSVSAKKFICNFRAWFEPSNADQTGSMSINFLDGNDKMICSYIIEKTTRGSNTGSILVRAGGTNPVNFFKQDYNIFDGWLNFVRSTGAPDLHGGMADIYKEGGTISAYFNGTRKSVYVPELAESICEKIQIYIGQYGTDKMVDRAYFMWLAFQKNHVEKIRDIPNRYPGGSKVDIAGEESKIYVNGIPKMSDEIKGSQYFLAPPGETKVQFYYSPFSVPAPQITAEIREAWL